MSDPAPIPAVFPGPEVFRLDGRAALITGGARGPGAAIAHGFARAGAAVTLADRDPGVAEATAESIQAHGGRAIAVEVEVTEPARVEAAVRRSLEAWGRLDILVNSA